MQYPLYVHRDGSNGFRASFADLPLAFARGATLEELRSNAQSAVELAYDRSEQLIPGPTGSVSELQSLAMDDGNGIWMYVEINLVKVTSKAVSVQFSLPDTLLRQVDACAKRRSLTRSAFFALAAAREVGDC
ncbi:MULTISPECIES: type II toxin-antitoxin system HicB family antitoxin [unclassified Caballeronia]|uniref:type II toxin-antitoxin system HicB family antitoxin n=1 Tax=unclassified Caballeronia TaxID=2646786 RepID=UPI0028664FD2|nr:MULTISPECIES: type II toxin-antitoxin system HicB family antitoxin [unclassified Caballeronia]MDR5737642.1 type II toxin-antitoxin system HicB family antitoxin [Caballeronia sp. LZ016]MDR5809824.1 type II toxin-antitoxin system HicB family antitoxin [Caballeronia sp. LZ019]